MHHIQIPIPVLFHSVYLDGPFVTCISCERDLGAAQVPYAIQKEIVGTEPVFEMAICMPCQHEMQQQLSADSRAAIQDFMNRHLGDAASTNDPATEDQLTRDRATNDQSTEDEQVDASTATASDDNGADDNGADDNGADDNGAADDESDTQLESFLRLLMGPPDVDWESQLAKCVLCPNLRSDCRKFSISGMFFQSDMLVQGMIPGGMRLPFMVCSDCSTTMNRLLSRQTRDSWDRFVEEHFDGPPGIEMDWSNSPTVFV